MTDGDRSDEGTVGRPERKRRRRAKEFLDAAQRIVAAESFEALTMARLARELDTVDSAVYRYFPSKGALIAEIQREALERLGASLSDIGARGDALFDELGLAPAHAAVARLVLFGRWLCATEDTYPEELRLLQMIMTRQTSALDPEGGQRIFPVAMQLLGHAVNAIQTAQDTRAISEGSPLDRAVIWSSGVSGVLQTDDLEQYAPELFGKTRLAQQASLDLLAGWGADRVQLAEGGRLVDRLAADGPLAP